MAEEKGMAIFLDVFRRADKNDDNSLSWDEFRSFFADGVLSEEELKELFVKVDVNKSNNIDTSELCNYFTQHIGSFRGIFSAIDDINVAITKALHSSSQDYNKSSLYDQFVTRFLMREIVNQITALQRPLEVASDHLDEEAQKNRKVCNPIQSGKKDKKEPIEISAEEAGVYSAGTIMPGRVSRRIRRQLSSQISTYGEVSSGIAGSFDQQLARLQSLVDKLENKVTFDPVEEEEVTYGQEDLHVIVHRKFVCLSTADKSFRTSLRAYVESSSKTQGCLHLNVRTFPNSNLYALYEIWDTDTDWRNQYRSDHNRKFQHSNIDNLEVPEQNKVMHVPSTWWKHE